MFAAPTTPPEAVSYLNPQLSQPQTLIDKEPFNVNSMVEVAESNRTQSNEQARVERNRALGIDKGIIIDLYA